MKNERKKMNNQRSVFIQNETNLLRSVVLGIAHDQGDQLDINPVSKYHIAQGTYPTESDTMRELQAVEEALKAENVEVLRPRNLVQTEQIFTRDIGFVIDDRFIVSNMREPVRQPEIEGIDWLLEELGEEKIIRMPEGAIIEGGDVVLYNEHVFVGIGKRTNKKGFEHLKSLFPKKQFHGLALNVTSDPKTNILHLDCTFQPVGDGLAIIYENGFQQKPHIIYELFDEDQLIKITQEEMNNMFPNIFSISPQMVIIEENFTRLIQVLEKKGITCLTVPYSETSKLSGLLRCSTLPLERD